MPRCLSRVEIAVIHKALIRAAGVIRAQRRVLLGPARAARETSRIDLAGLTDDLREWVIEMGIALNRLAYADQILRGRRYAATALQHRLRTPRYRPASAPLARARRRITPHATPDLFT